MTQLAVLVLAAGKGTRMKSDLPKVLHPLAHRPMILHVLDAVHPLTPTRTLVVTGHGADQVEATIHTAYPKTICVRQPEQLGTGHAVLQAQAALQDFPGTTLILNGDVPLIEPQALQTFLAAHHAAHATISVATAYVSDPTGLGRILRDAAGTFTGIREHKDCTADELLIDEINVGIYAVATAQLFPLLAQVTNANAQQEYYLPDIVPLGLHAGHTVLATELEQHPDDLGGINNRAQLADAETVLQDRYRMQHMLNGVTLQDPATTYFAWDTQIEPDVTVEPGVIFQPGVTVQQGSRIKAYSVIAGANVGPYNEVGPFARLRPGTELAAHVKVGNFVELKAATVGAHSRMSHLAYIGDADIGANSNFGAGAILANYNHHTKEKFRTRIGNNASVGANTTLVAPLQVGDNALIAAGATILRDIPANTKVIDKQQQVRTPHDAVPTTTEEAA